MSNTTTPTVWLRWLRRERANRLGRYPSLLATFRTRVRVRAEMRLAAGPSFSTMETVVIENPLSPATSRIVTIVVFGGPSPLCSGRRLRGELSLCPPCLPDHRSYDTGRTISGLLLPGGDWHSLSAAPDGRAWQHPPTSQPLSGPLAESLQR